jgi:hypothetical protein
MKDINLTTGTPHLSAPKTLEAGNFPLLWGSFAQKRNGQKIKLMNFAKDSHFGRTDAFESHLGRRG